MTHYDDAKESFRCEHGRVRGGNYPCPTCEPERIPKEERYMGPPTDRRLRVYIAGPMTNGGNGYDMAAIHKAIQVHIKLINLGYVSHCPQLTVFCDFMSPNAVPYDTWLKLDHCYINDVDVVLRLPGPSKGADRECGYARSISTPVCEGLEKFLSCFPDPGTEGIPT